MSNVQVYCTEDLIILESKKQTIAAIGFSLSKHENRPLINLAYELENYLSSFGYSYVIRLTKTYARFFVLVSAKNPGDAIEEVSKILSKMDRLKVNTQKFIVSPLNHTIIMGNLELKAQSSIKKTQNPRILQIDNKFWLIYSLIIGNQERNYFTKFLKSLLSLKSSTLNLSIKNTKKHGKAKKGSEITNSILITQSFNSLEDCENFLFRMKQMSAPFQERFSCTLRFHTASEVKQNIYAFMLGLSPVNQPINQWHNVLKLDLFLPSITSYDNSFIDTNNEEIHRKLLSVELDSDETTYPKEITDNKLSADIQGRQHNLKTQDSLILYGKKVSNEELEELVETIPTPPT